MASGNLWGGLDTGADTSRLCLIDDRLEPVLDVTLPSETWVICEALASYSSDIEEIALEATSTSTHLLRGLREAGLAAVAYEVVQVSRYLRVRRNKTDRNDARGLAEIAKLGLPSVAKVHLKSPETQQLRARLLFRHKLTQHRVACEAMIRSLIRLHGGNLVRPFKAPEIERLVRDELVKIRATHDVDLVDDVMPLLQLCRTMRHALRSMERQLERVATTHPVCSRFLGIPGVGPICAISFYTAIEDPSRFRRAVDVGPYLGLTPRVLQSGVSLRHGRISRMGNKLTRAHLSCAASALLAERAPLHPLKAWGLQLAERAGRKKARVAVSRRLAVMMLAMWKSGRPYEPALAASPQAD